MTLTAVLAVPLLLANWADSVRVAQVVSAVVNFVVLGVVVVVHISGFALFHFGAFLTRALSGVLFSLTFAIFVFLLVQPADGIQLSESERQLFRCFIPLAAGSGTFYALAMSYLRTLVWIMERTAGLSVARGGLDVEVGGAKGRDREAMGGPLPVDRRGELKTDVADGSDSETSAAECRRFPAAVQRDDRVLGLRLDWTLISDLSSPSPCACCVCFVARGSGTGCDAFSHLCRCVRLVLLRLSPAVSLNAGPEVIRHIGERVAQAASRRGVGSAPVGSGDRRRRLTPYLLARCSSLAFSLSRACPCSCCRLSPTVPHRCRGHTLTLPRLRDYPSRRLRRHRPIPRRRHRPADRARLQGAWTAAEPPSSSVQNACRITPGCTQYLFIHGSRSCSLAKDIQSVYGHVGALGTSYANFGAVGTTCEDPSLTKTYRFNNQGNVERGAFNFYNNARVRMHPPMR